MNWEKRGFINCIYLLHLASDKFITVLLATCSDVVLWWSGRSSILLKIIKKKFFFHHHNFVIYLDIHASAFRDFISVANRTFCHLSSFLFIVDELKNVNGHLFFHHLYVYNTKLDSSLRTLMWLTCNALTICKVHCSNIDSRKLGRTRFWHLTTSLINIK